VLFLRKRVCIVTSTRADYGLLKPVIHRIIADDELELELVATGMHLCPEFGLTYKEIEKDGIPISDKIEMSFSSDTSAGMTKTMGHAMIAFADYFEQKRPDMLIIDSDRFEMLTCAAAAAMARIPIAHMSGGDTTEGAIDEFCRHSITKMSYLHFTSTEQYKRRVEQLGESPDRVFYVGSTGVENVMNIDLLPLEDLEESIGFKLGDMFALVTFHPVTMEAEDSLAQFGQLLNAIDRFPDMKFIFTKANADENGRAINLMIDKYVSEHENCIAFASLGLQRYLSTMKYAKMVIGNSSSGIYETPSFKIPTVNIGDRQKGRIQADSVINCNPISGEIVDAIKTGLVKDCSSTINPYRGDNPSKSIVEITKEFLIENKIDLKKKFWDV